MRTRGRAVLLSLGLLSASALVLGQLMVGCVFNSAHDCVDVLGFEGCESGASVSSSSGGGDSGTGGRTTSSTSTSTSGGGSGGMTGCAGANGCPAPPAGPCQSLGKAVCNEGVCGIEYTAGPAPSQVYGNCKIAMCDVNGVVSQVDDLTDVFDDGNPCTDDTCTSGKPSNDLVGGKSCPLGTGMGVCALDPFFMLPSCVECLPNDPQSCFFAPGTTCIMNKCVPSHCTNGLKDAGESAIDCGGITGCPKCASGKACFSYQDCASQVCASGTCASLGCEDGTKNGSESDKDCGGSQCFPCVEGLNCMKATDCQSSVCLPTGMGQPNHCAAPSCTDGVQNGDETGIDCGGATCSACM